MNADKVLDAKGLACPMPIVKTRKEMKDMDSGQVLEIQATDKGASADLTAWAKSGGHDLLEQQVDGDVLKFWIKKAEYQPSRLQRRAEMLFGKVSFHEY